MSDGTISIDVELNEQQFRASLDNMGEITRIGSERMIKSIGELSGSFIILPETITSIMGVVPGIINSVIQAINSKNPVMTSAGFDFFTSLVSNISGAAKNIVGTIPGLANSVARRFTDFKPDMTNTGFDLFTALVSNISGAAKNIVNTIPGITDSITRRFTDFTPDMTNTGFNLFTALAANIPEAAKNIGESVREITGNIAERIADDEYLIANAGFGLFTALTSRLPRAIRDVSKAPGEIVSALVEQFADLYSQFNAVGENIVHGVWAGISSMGGWLSNSVQSFFSGIVGAVTGFLGISSPSKLFRDLVGKNIILGVKSGIDAEMPMAIAHTKEQIAKLTGIAARSSRLDFPVGVSGYAAFGSGFQGYNAGSHAGNGQNASLGSNNQPVTPEINITLEPSGDMRGFFDYIRMGVKRSAYLSGEE